MPPFRLSALTNLFHEHFPAVNPSVLPDHGVELAAKVGEAGLDVSADLATDAVRDQASPDQPAPASSHQWDWDHDPFQPGVQLVADPLTVDLPAAPDLAVPDLPHHPDLPDHVPHDGLDIPFS